MKYTQDMSKVEVKGFEARFYDRLMDILTLGYYPFFIREVIKDIGLKKGDRVLDLGAGTGRNDILMLKYIKDEGEIVALEIGKEMINQFNKNCKNYKNIKLLKQRIDKPLSFKEEFDVVFISFVLHGFIQEKRDIIINNAYNALKNGGKFVILDYSNFDIEKANFFIKFFIKKIECPLAEDFIRRDTKSMLKKFGFNDFEENFYFWRYIRLLKAYKKISS